MEYDLEIQRCMQQQQQRQQHENGMIDEPQDQREQQQQISHLQRMHSQQIPFSHDNNGGDVQHAYISSNGDGNSGPYESHGGGPWDNTGQNNQGNYIDFIGPQDVKRGRFENGNYCCQIRRHLALFFHLVSFQHT